LSVERLATIAETVRTAAYRVRELKGSTWDAIGLAVAALVRGIVRDHGRIVPVSVRVADRLCASLPCVLGPDGAGKPLPPRMDEQEAGARERSLEMLRQALTMLPGDVESLMFFVRCSAPRSASSDSSFASRLPVRHRWDCFAHLIKRLHDQSSANSVILRTPRTHPLDFLHRCGSF
jgi:hypothetical protein